MSAKVQPLSADQVNAGALVTVSLHSGPGAPSDRLALFAVGAADEAAMDWLYLNGTKETTDVGITSADWTVRAPITSGSYEFRLLSGEDAVAVSPAFTVTGVEIFLDFDGGHLPDLVGVVEVAGSTGLDHEPFVSYGGQESATQIAQIIAEVQEDFADFAVPIIHDNQWSVNPSFGAGDAVILVGGDGTWIAGDNPTVSTTSVNWIAGIAPWDIGNVAANVGFAFADATASAFGTLGRSATQFVQHVANTISHEIGHTFGIDHVTALKGTQELMGTAETGTQINGDGKFTSVVLPRQHGGAYVSRNYLMELLGPSQSEFATGLIASTFEDLPDDGPTGIALVVSEPLESTADQNDSHAELEVANGNFDVGDPADATFAWTTRGAVTVIDNAVVLNESQDFITGVSQTFVMPDADTLQFTILEATLNGNIALPPDALEAALLDASTLNPLSGTAQGLNNTDAFFSIQQNGEVYFGSLTTVPGVSASGQNVSLNLPLTVQLDVRGVTPGTEAILSFDLIGFDPAISSVRLDDVLFNHLPIASAGGDYTVDEGGVLALDAFGSFDSDGQTLTYSWDVNGDGVFGDATGVAATLSWAELQDLGITDNGEFTVSVRVTDELLGQTVGMAHLTVKNAPPTASLSNDGPVVEGSTAVVSFSDPFDASNADTAAGFTYSYDFDNDDNFEIVGDPSSSATVPAAFLGAGPGSQVVRARIEDKDGGFTDYTTTITVSELVEDQQPPSGLLMTPTAESVISQDPGYVEIQWADLGPAGLDHSTFGVGDITITGVTVDDVQDLGGGLVRYSYALADSLPAGPIEVTLVAGEVTDLARNTNESSLQTFTFELPAPQDVTELVDVKYFGTRIISRPRLFTFFGTVTNTSDQPLYDPITVFWVDVQPLSIEPLLMDADPTLVGLLPGTPGYQLQTDDGILEPGESTLPRSFTLRNLFFRPYDFGSSVRAATSPANATSSSVSAAALTVEVPSLYVWEAVRAHFGQTGVGPEEGDQDNDGDVDFQDFLDVARQHHRRSHVAEAFADVSSFEVDAVQREQLNPQLENYDAFVDDEMLDVLVSDLTEGSSRRRRVRLDQAVDKREVGNRTRTRGG